MRKIIKTILEQEFNDNWGWTQDINEYVNMSLYNFLNEKLKYKEEMVDSPFEGIEPFNSKTIRYDSLDGEVYHINITFMSKKDVFNHVFNWVSDDYPDMETRIVRTTIRKYLNDVIYGY